MWREEQTVRREEIENLDLFLSNGNPYDLIQVYHRDVEYQEPPLSFHGAGNGFENVSAQSGPLFTRNFSARGLAGGDFNNDGGVDILVSLNGGVPLLLRNNVGKLNHWVGLTLVGTKLNRDAAGARVTYQVGRLKRSRMKTGGGSFL